MRYHSENREKRSYFHSNKSKNGQVACFDFPGDDDDEVTQHTFREPTRFNVSIMDDVATSSLSSPSSSLSSSSSSSSNDYKSSSLEIVDYKKHEYSNHVSEIILDNEDFHTIFKSLYALILENIDMMDKFPFLNTLLHPEVSKNDQHETASFRLNPESLNRFSDNNTTDKSFLFLVDEILLNALEWCNLITDILVDLVNLYKTLKNNTINKSEYQKREYIILTTLCQMWATKRGDIEMSYKTWNTDFPNVTFDFSLSLFENYCRKVMSGTEFDTFSSNFGFELHMPKSFHLTKRFAVYVNEELNSNHCTDSNTSVPKSEMNALLVTPSPLLSRLFFQSFKTKTEYIAYQKYKNMDDRNYRHGNNAKIEKIFYFNWTQYFVGPSFDFDIYNSSHFMFLMKRVWSFIPLCIRRGLLVSEREGSRLKHIDKLKITRFLWSCIFRPYLSKEEGEDGGGDDERQHRLKNSVNLDKIVSVSIDFFEKISLGKGTYDFNRRKEIESNYKEKIFPKGNKAIEEGKNPGLFFGCSALSSMKDSQSLGYSSVICPFSKKNASNRMSEEEIWIYETPKCLKDLGDIEDITKNNNKICNTNNNINKNNSSQLYQISISMGLKDACNYCTSSLSSSSKEMEWRQVSNSPLRFNNPVERFIKSVNGLN